MSKNVKVFVSLVLVVFLALAATNIEARYINYGDLNGGDHALACDKANPGSCKKQEVNHYRRGCETEERCRGSR
ncbi:protein RALF-like 15 [Raphanus sativus]|uniref:Protein RALF-like 15 n=1 Tax=Raphanus sativus TaxID=3726 RepID=A0A6J0JRJ8_RAPSA|nr:protein RALF-like 15 [Raphanus sativus]